jgi:glucokinase
MLSSVLDFRQSFVAGSVALGYGDDFFAAATKAARETAKLSYSHDVEILPSKLGGNGPLLGAALVGWRGVS